MKKMMRRMVQTVLVAATALVTVLVSGVPAQASDDGGFKEEVRAYADLYRVDEDVKMADGIRIAGLDVSGMTLMEAVDAVLARQEAMKSAEITLMLEDRSVTYTMEQFGMDVEVSAEEVVKVACIGKQGSLIERYKMMADVKNDGYDIVSEQYAKAGIVADKIAKFAAVVDIPAVEATITKDGSKFIVTHEESGIAADQEDMLAQVLTAIENWDGETSIVLRAKEVVLEPKYTYAALATISDCLGGYETICGELPSDRGKNVIAGAEKLNGLVVLPGESLSVVDVLAPFTEENGYYPGVQYKEGEYDIALGGGVCSLSTTLYNALLYAELQIDKRWNHSMTVSYVPYGFDSTINDDGSRDLVFTNNYDTPIYIEAYTYDTPDWIDDWLYFNIYGKETRDMSRRQLKFYNVVLEKDTPTRDEFTFIIDEDLAPGEEVWVQGNYSYVKAEAYKEVWVDGQMVSKELLHTDTYQRSPAIVHYNPAPAETEAPTEAPTEEESEAPESVESDTSAAVD